MAPPTATDGLPKGGLKNKWVIGGVALTAGIVGWAYLHRSRQVAGPDVGSEQLGTELPPADLSTVTTGGGTSTTGLTFITTNAQWTSDAVAKMVDLGFDAVAVSTAIGKYLANQSVSAQEAIYIQTAIAVSGKPPEGEHSIRFEPVPPPTTPPPSSGGGATTPRPGQVTGLRIHKRTSRNVYLEWNHTNTALAYALNRNGKRINIVPTRKAVVGNIHATYTVQAINARGLYGPPSAPLSV